MLLGFTGLLHTTYWSRPVPLCFPFFAVGLLNIEDNLLLMPLMALGDEADADVEADAVTPADKVEEAEEPKKPSSSRYLLTTREASLGLKVMRAIGKM
jgi:hypothetical protein